MNSISPVQIIRAGTSGANSHDPRLLIRQCRADIVLGSAALIDNRRLVKNDRAGTDSSRRLDAMIANSANRHVTRSGRCRLNHLDAIGISTTNLTFTCPRMRLTHRRGCWLAHRRRADRLRCAEPATSVSARYYSRNRSDLGGSRPGHFSMLPRDFAAFEATGAAARRLPGHRLWRITSAAKAVTAGRVDTHSVVASPRIFRPDGARVSSATRTDDSGTTASGGL